MVRRVPRRSAGLVVSTSLALVAGACCRKPPSSVVEVNLALSRAKDACAAVYAPQELADVERRVEAMNRIADAGKCRTAGSAAEPMKPEVMAFCSLVEARKDLARSEAGRALADADAAMARARGGASDPPSPGALDAAERALSMARRMSEDACSYLRAASLAREAVEAAGRARGAAADGGGEARRN
jgi:hypothetical protein